MSPLSRFSVLPSFLISFAFLGDSTMEADGLTVVASSIGVAQPGRAKEVINVFQEKVSILYTELALSSIRSSLFANRSHVLERNRRLHRMASLRRRPRATTFPLPLPSQRRLPLPLRSLSTPIALFSDVIFYRFRPRGG